MKHETQLRPIPYSDDWHKRYKLAIIDGLERHIFMPLLESVNYRSDNSRLDDLERYFREGRVRLVDGVFEGNLSFRIRGMLKKIGATVEGHQLKIQSFSILPHNIQLAIKSYRNSMNQLQKRFDKKFEKIDENKGAWIKNLNFSEYANHALSMVSRQFNKTVKEKLAVQPKLDRRGMAQIKEDYLTTVELPIRVRLRHEFEKDQPVILENFSQEIVEKLRIGLKKKILDGEPRDEIRRYITSRLRVSKTRAKFIARQETGLLTTEFKKAQYTQWGIDKYRWNTMHDHKVRERHVELDGMVFDWHSPPIVDEKTGRRGHPGQDFNCRCQSLPIVEW